MSKANSNPYSKLRNVDVPYEIWKSFEGDWEWRVLKKAGDNSELSLIWHCAVSSPNTYGSWEYGDVYASTITENALRIYIDPAVDFFAGLRPLPSGKAFTLPNPDQPGTLMASEVFPFLSDYFAENGMSYHASNMRGDLLFFLSVELDQCQNILDSPWELSYSDDNSHKFEIYLIVNDQPDDPLHVPFIFMANEDDQVYEMIRIVEQTILPFYLLTRVNGSLYFVDARKVELPKTLNVQLSFTIRDMLNTVKNRTMTAQALKKSEEFVVSNGMEPSDDQTQILLASLKNKSLRLVSAIALCSTCNTAYIEPVVSIIDKIVWDEVDDLAHALSNFGVASVSALIPLASSGKKASAACAMRALGMIGGIEAIDTLIERLIALPSKSEPTEALVMIGKPAISSLITSTKHAKADVRAMAVFALGKIGDPVVMPLLDIIAESDRSDKVRNIAERAVDWLNGDEVCDIDLRNFFGSFAT